MWRKVFKFITQRFNFKAIDGHSVSSLEEIVVSAGYHVLSRPGRISGPSLELLKKYLLIFKNKFYFKINSTFFFRVWDIRSNTTPLYELTGHTDKVRFYNSDKKLLKKEN